ncbi:hypothetical protein BZZ01_23215 [Nostocales cyanobacterium HT-58-2]|nr:hypothetical protein BZZ01_23215 [Nostocales cyanobacterium HT-58-2]
MKKQKLRLSFGFLLLCAGCLVSATPLKVYAGPNVVNGTSVESSTFSGDSFNRTNQSAPTQIVPGTNVSVEVNGTISIPQKVQQTLNNVATRIVDQSGCGDRISSGFCLETPRSAIAVILVRGSAASTATSQVQTSLSSSGIPQSLITVLVNNVAGLLKGFDYTATPGINVSGLQPVQLVANNQLALGGGNYNTDITQLDATIKIYDDIVPISDTVLVNNVAGVLEGFDSQATLGTGLQLVRLIVDVGQLNTAIKAYNDIVLQSDVETLTKLSKNLEFVEIGRVLKELRAALRASQ